MKIHPALTEEHEAFRGTMRRFVAKEISPYATEWDEAGEFPREMYRKAASAGLLGVGFPEEYGGTPADLLMLIEGSTRRFISSLLAGEKISALAITEPSGGSDVARLLTSAKLEGNEYVVNGEKTFITGGAEEIMKDLAARQLGWQ